MALSTVENYGDFWLNVVETASLLLVQRKRESWGPRRSPGMRPGLEAGMQRELVLPVVPASLLLSYEDAQPLLQFDPL